MVFFNNLIGKIMINEGKLVKVDFCYEFRKGMILRYYCILLLFFKKD